MKKQIHQLIDKNQSQKKQIQEETQELDNFFNTMPVGFFRIDENENYILVNNAYAEIFGYTREEMLYPGLNITKTWAIAEEKNLLLLEARRKELKGIIINCLRKDGSIGSQELFIKARYSDEGDFLGYEGYAKDVSERLESLNGEAEARRRAEFLVDLMSHDINNIDQGILMLLEYILLDKELPEKYQDPIKMAVEQVHYATELIKNVKKLQAVLEEPINLTIIDPYPAIIQASEAAKGAFPQKTLNVEIGFEAGTVYILADSFVKDLFFNIFHNSMKHSEGEEVKLDIQTTPSQVDEMVEIHISDYGPGIPNEEKKRILQRRLGAKGSGIGLTLVNYLLDRYEGFVQVKDRVEGQQSMGSKFILIMKRGR
ncbi:MAG: PAS domain-containing sensor histidine kinase [Candidatus Bathyarchaeota archaeon]|nr:PAS domain-containing sensor histidine kinase [Candidatus Bathyarchaeota archaeon]